MTTNKSWSRTKKTKLLQEFDTLYPDPQSELNFRNDFQLIVSVILSAQCTDKKVNEVTPALFRAFPNFKRLAGAPVPEVETIIRPVNYFRSKAKNLVSMANRVTSLHRGRVPQTRKELEALSGVGRKTASVVLSEKGIEPALAVDTHVFRVSKRLGLASAQDRDKVEEEIKAHFPPEKWRELHHWLILHGRRVCKAQKPLCEECTVRKLCDFNTQQTNN